jgi:hypothetical protein
VAVHGGGGTFAYEWNQNQMSNKQDEDISTVNLNIGLLGKYPFAIKNKLSLFPLLGIDYQICLSAKDEDGDELDFYGNKAGDLSALWFKFGVGLDVALTEKLYLSFEALMGIRPPNAFEKDMKDRFEDYFTGDVDVKVDETIAGGMSAKLAVGYKF